MFKELFGRRPKGKESAESAAPLETPEETLARLVGEYNNLQNQIRAGDGSTTQKIECCCNEKKKRSALQLPLLASSSSTPQMQQATTQHYKLFYSNIPPE